jgi:hypothetical protein
MIAIAWTFAIFLGAVLLLKREGVDLVEDL